VRALLVNRKFENFALQTALEDAFFFGDAQSVQKFLYGVCAPLVFANFNEVFFNQAQNLDSLFARAA
jgi:hypothetical protein